MNQLKNIIRLGAFCLAIFSISTLFAQRHHHGSPEKRLEKMKEELNLTDTQVNQIKTIHEKYREKMEALRANEEIENRREAHHQLREAKHAEIKSVLNEEQQAKMEEIHSERKARKERRKERWDNVDKKAFRAEMKKYKDANMLPVMLTQRAKLESAISAEDKETIADLRVKMEARKAKREAADKNGECADKRGRHHKMRGDRNSEDHQTMKALLEKYKADIQPLMEEIAPQRKQWKADMKAIKEKYVGKMEDGREGKAHHHRGRHGKFKKGKKAAKFLLLDPNQPIVENSDIISTDDRMVDVRVVNVFPNPAVTSNTLEYEVTAPGRIVIELRDKQGNVIQTVENSYKNPGGYKLNVDLSGLKSGIYLYSIQSENDVLTKKFMLSK